MTTEQDIIDIIENDSSLSYRYKHTLNPVELRHRYLEILINNDRVGVVCRECEYYSLDPSVTNLELRKAIKSFSGEYDG